MLFYERISKIDKSSQEEVLLDPVSVPIEWKLEIEKSDAIFLKEKLNSDPLYFKFIQRAFDQHKFEKQIVDSENSISFRAIQLGLHIWFNHLIMFHDEDELYQNWTSTLTSIISSDPSVSNSLILYLLSPGC